MRNTVGGRRSKKPIRRRRPSNTGQASGRSRRLNVRLDRVTARCGSMAENLIGTRWTRRPPAEPDDGWNKVQIVGVFDAGESGGGLELVVAPEVFGEAPV